ncbi:MAG TPA: Smr/MutS family protein [Burkholderiales bacterium]|nr:Smr/MutS family protein [Burkholderiales bacterium]
MPPPNEQDSQVFRDAVAGAVPLAPSDRVRLRPALPQPLPLQTLKNEREALNESLAPWDTDAETGEELIYLRAGLSRQVLRKLRRGHWVVQDEIDLHGANRDQAKAMLSEFFQLCRRRGLRCVRVIHGKGRGSKTGSLSSNRKSDSGSGNAKKCSAMPKPVQSRAEAERCWCY